jgi:hypothetical protein
MSRRYRAVVEVSDYWMEDEPDGVAAGLQNILDAAFEYIDGHDAKVIGEVTVTEVDE